MTLLIRSPGPQRETFERMTKDCPETRPVPVVPVGSPWQKSASRDDAGARGAGLVEAARRASPVRTATGTIRVR